MRADLVRREWSPRTHLPLPLVSAALAVALWLPAFEASASGATRRDTDSAAFDCAYRPSADWFDELLAAYQRGEIADPAARPVPPLPQTAPHSVSRHVAALSHDDIFPFEDTDGLLLTDFSEGALYDLMIVAANALLSVHGDNYDFIGYWLNFAPHHEIGAAFHLSFENDVIGIGADLYELREKSGLGGDHIEGFVMMWNINSVQWQPGGSPDADYTRLVLCHEFEHRFGVFLPDLSDGRQMQGGCGYQYHWNTKVDGQGSAMDISEWTGSSPASLVTSFGFNADILGGAYSYTDLYLMGYVTPQEMDSGNSELRYMDNWNCMHPLYFGSISSFSSSDIIDAAGPRVPDAASEDKDYRTGWIMIHLPGDAPDVAELDKAIGILEQNMIDWSTSTLGRGTMDHSLEDPTGSPEDLAAITDEILLENPRPNPMTRSTLVRYSLARATPVTVTIHEVSGRLVATLIDEFELPGRRSLWWNGRSDSGMPVASGFYFVRLVTENGLRATKLVIVK